MIRAGIAAATALLAATTAMASPIGTPQSNAPRTGKGTGLDLPFGHRRDAAPATAIAANGATESAVPVAPRRRLTQAEWRKAYIARHGHDLVAPAHPGH